MTDPARQREKQKRQREQVIAKAVRNRDQTREKLLAQGRQLARRRAENIERSRKRREDRSDTTASGAHSTLPSMDTNGQVAAQHSHSTVPAQPKGSTVPAATRLYGLLLYMHIQSEDHVRDDHPTLDSDADRSSSRNGESHADEAAVTTGGEPE